MTSEELEAGDTVAFGLPTDIAIDRAIARKSFWGFVRIAFDVIEPHPFTPGWHLRAICEHLEAVARGVVKRLAINIPPGHAKSILTSVLWPAWVWSQWPSKKFIFASYAESLAVRDSVKCRALIASPWYQARWNRVKIMHDQDTKTEYANTRGGFRLALGTGGSVTGRHCDYQVCDDPLKASEAHSKVSRESVVSWYRETMSTRLLPHGARVIIMQRLHEQDLTGHVLEQGGYDHLCLPEEYEGSRSATSIGFSDPRTDVGDLLWPERFPSSLHEQRKRELGSYGVAGQLQQRPAPAKGGILRPEHLRAYRELPSQATYRWDSWDLSFKGNSDSDFVVGIKFAAHGGNVYLVDMIRGRLDFPATLEAIKRLRSACPPAPAAILIEDAANGPAVISVLRQQIPGIIPVKPDGSKEARAHSVAAMLESGNVFVPEQAPWLEALRAELIAFPNGANDDICDSLTQSLRWFQNSGIASFSAALR